MKSLAVELTNKHIKNRHKTTNNVVDGGDNDTTKQRKKKKKQTVSIERDKKEQPAKSQTSRIKCNKELRKRRKKKRR